MRLNNLKVALVYDRINKFGGAERVLLSLHELFPNAPLYTLVYKSKTTSWANKIKVIPSFLNLIPWFRSRHEILAPFSSLAFETFNFKNYDLVISVTSESAKAIITSPNTLHICYCLTPTRYLWSGREEYQDQPGFGLFSPLVKKFLASNHKSLQKKDLIISSRPDHYLSISNEVKKRVEKYYQRSSSVIYPPIEYDFWSQFSKASKNKDYYLVVSRLVPYKKVDLVVRAFKKKQLSHQKLVIVGTGSQLNTLQSLATKNVTFLGAVNDQDLRKIYAHAKALIFPQTEDFGLVPLEAQATGTPVLAYAKGGALETVINKQTGLFFNNQNTESIIKVIDIFERGVHKITASKCRMNAKQFDQKKFKQKFSAKVETLWTKQTL